MDEYFIQKISHRLVANSTPEAVFVAVDVKMLYDDLRAVSDLTAAVSTNRFTGPLWRGTGQVAVVAVGCSLWISQIYKAATAIARGGRQLAAVHVLLHKEDPFSV